MVSGFLFLVVLTWLFLSNLWVWSRSMRIRDLGLRKTNLLFLVGIIVTMLHLPASDLLLPHWLEHVLALPYVFRLVAPVLVFVLVFPTEFQLVFLERWLMSFPWCLGKGWLLILRCLTCCCLTMVLTILCCVAFSLVVVCCYHDSLMKSLKFLTHCFGLPSSSVDRRCLLSCVNRGSSSSGVFHCSFLDLHRRLSGGPAVLLVDLRGLYPPFCLLLLFWFHHHYSWPFNSCHDLLIQLLWCDILNEVRYQLRTF